MKVKIDRIIIDRFKKLMDLDIDLNGQSATILAENGLGKTTIIDAIHWLFTGTDSGHKAGFGILEIDREGQTINHQDSSVSVHISVKKTDNEPAEKIILRREYRQKWTNKRGQEKAVLTNHTTSFFWNEVPILKNEYSKRLSGIASIDVIRSLIDTDFFCGKMKPGARRKILMGMVDLSGFSGKEPGRLKKMSMADAKKLLNSRKLAVNHDLKTLPGRIDELKRLLPSVEPGDHTKSDIEKIDLKIKEAEKEFKALNHSVSNSPENTKLINTRHKLKEIESAIDFQYSNKSERLTQDLLSLEKRLKEILPAIKRNTSDILRIDYEIKENRQKRDDLKNEWIKIKGSEYEPYNNCLTCGQALPEKTIMDQEKEFKESVEKRLSFINGQGQDLFSYFKKLEERKTAAEKDKSDLLKEETSLKVNRSLVEKTIDGLLSEKAEKKKSQAKALAMEIKTLEDLVDKRESEISHRRTELEKTMHDLFYEKKSMTENTIDSSQNAKIMVRMKGREAQLKKAAIEYEKIELELYELEAYSMARSAFIELEVNEKFKMVKWRMFEKQINGGTREICEPMVDGILYNQDLNTGAKINAGIDTIISLSDHYNISFPVLIDNAESVTEWAPFFGQTVKMSASSDHKELTVKIE